MYIRLALAISLSAVATSATAADFPSRRAGLWTMAITVDGKAMAMADTRMCIDGTTDAKMMKAGMSMKGADCAPVGIHGMGNTRTVDSVCHMNGGQQKSHIVMTYSGDSAYHMDMQTQFTPALYGRSQSHQMQDAKWIGPCPAGMMPGDMMIHGMKINMLDSANTPAGGQRLTPAQIRALMKAHQHP